MLIDVGVVTVILIFGNIVFWKFDPFLPLWKRGLKFLLIVGAAGLISNYFGHLGVAIAFGIALLPIVYIHGIWLPRRGVNGWTAEPRDKYYALKGWPPPK